MQLVQHASKENFNLEMNLLIRFVPVGLRAMLVRKESTEQILLMLLAITVPLDNINLEINLLAIRVQTGQHATRVNMFPHWEPTQEILFAVQFP